MKFSHGSKQLWHTWDRPKDEVPLRTRTVERGILTHGAEMDIDGDWERGRVWFKKLSTEERAITIYRLTNSTSTEVATSGVPGWNEDFTASWNEAMEEVFHAKISSLQRKKHRVNKLFAYNGRAW